MQKMMNERRNKKGFTLAELLIVVAIIAVLVAIAIPIFSSQLEKSRESTDIANVRSAYAEITTSYLEEPSAYEATVTAKQTQDGWQGKEGKLTTRVNGEERELTFDAKTDQYNVTINESGEISVN